MEKRRDLGVVAAVSWQRLVKLFLGIARRAFEIILIIYKYIFFFIYDFMKLKFFLFKNNVIYLFIVNKDLLLFVNNLV